MKRTLLPLFFLNLFLSVSYAKSGTKPLPKSPAPVLFKDEDGDGYGNPYMPYFSGSTTGYVNNNLDCDDTEPTWNPAGTEICDGYDNNCDGNIDEGFATVLYYNDNDHDGYGDHANVVSSCYVVVGRVTNGDDCNDFNPAITTGGTTWYKDADGDSYSDGTTSTFCYAPDGYYAAGPGFFTSGDCDDNDPAINPNTTYYKDADGDGYSDGTTVQSCTPPANYFAAASLLGITGDCDDTKPAINPGAVEICNDRVDNNCDGFIDEGCATTKLANSYCGITITTLAQYLSAIAVSGATDYQYEVRNDGLSYLQTYTSGSSSTVFRMSFVPGISNGNTYQVKVKAKTGGVWGPYGAACNITTNYPVQTTQLSASYCNTTVTALNQYLSATTVSSATNYRFLVTNAGLSYSQTYTSSTNSPVFRMSFVPGVLNGRTYSVQVAAMVGGIWGSYGNACNITVAIPINYTVSLIPDDCNSSVTSAGQIITSAAGTNAESYRFQLTNVGLSYSQVFETNSNTFRLSDFTGIVNGTT